MAQASTVIFPDLNIGLKIFSVRSGDSVNVLEETERYEYELDTPGYSIAERSGVLWHNRITHANEQGRIEPGNFVGLLPLELYDKKFKKKVSECNIEVQSKKLNYETEYRSMLEDIADRCADFLLQLESPVEQYLKPDDEINEATLAQRLYFLKGLLGGEDFQLALQRIIAMPNTRWREDIHSVNLHRARRLGSREVRQPASGGRRMELPDTHSLRPIMRTVPERIDFHDKRDTVDTPENRFVKHALTLFLQTLEELIEKLPRAGNYPGLRDDIDELIDYLEEALTHDVLSTVSRLDMLPLNSPVLQHKEGYRQVLRAWMLFELAARLSWKGGDDIYAAGKRDAAALYEYWVFFKLLDIVADVFELEKPPVEDLINDQDMVLRLKAGRHLAIAGIYPGTGRRLHIEFSYNRTFRAERDYPSGGSWSRQMRPDYTLSLWPDGFSQTEAEKQELITHVHFDAKYKIENLVKLFGKEDENLDEEQSYEKDPHRAGMYKRADLLKMHAYRDAIRRSAGAYILYPGTQDKGFRSFHELLPGLGAFPLRPNESDDGSVALSQFLREVAVHVSNRASQREQYTYHTYRIYKDNPPPAVRDMLPEAVNTDRTVSPVEQFVIVGTYKDSAHLKWIKNKGLYNFRADDAQGSLRLGKRESKASMILLRKHGEMTADIMLRIDKEGPRVFSKKRLIKRDYPSTRKGEATYLVYSVEALGSSNVLNSYQWNLSGLAGFKKGHQAAWPQAYSLSDLMGVAEIRETFSV